MYPQIKIAGTPEPPHSHGHIAFRRQKLAIASCFSLAALALLAATPAAKAQGSGTLTTLYTFSGGGDGGIPSSDLLLASDGNLYGTTIGLIVNSTAVVGLGNGTSGDYGTIFRVSPNAPANSNFTTLYTFTVLGNGVPLNGTSPRGGLLQSPTPNILYGTTSGINDALTFTFDELEDYYTYTYTNETVGSGTVFKYDINANALTTLYSFSGATDGRAPTASLILGSDGPLYGTTSGGAIFAPPGSELTATTASTGGSIFSITNNGTFTGLGELGGSAASGLTPNAGLVEGGDGNFYGTTSSGGSASIAGYTVSNQGTVFQVTRQGSFNTIYTFTGGNDGANPVGTLARVVPGNGYLYGTTSRGGSGYGTVFKITSSGELTTIHTFGGGGYNNNGDGGVPATKLIVGSDGNLYGTTSGYTTLTLNADIVTNYGTVFRISPDATSSGGTGFETLYYFQGGADGGTPLGGLVEGSDGALYGTTSTGGDFSNEGNDFGTVFKLVVPGLSGSSSSGDLPSFFNGEAALSDGVYYLAFANGNYFGYYADLGNDYIYHFDLGYEYVFDAKDGNNGVYLYDFASNDFFYTSPTFPFPYLYDFTLRSVLYYYPNTGNQGHYTSNPRYFYDYATSSVITR